ncbi:MAG: pilus assembly protein N-terminal domain-containing protein, partial [Pirellulaceae bacterium]|nr:pilus assembly protein N-terminal domain-containing protein [Pirellulaceae bacterium]
VDNPDVVQVQPLSPNQVQISARKPGVTNIKLWDENDRVYLVDIVVLADARELENILISEFPNASLRVRSLSTSVVISGFVPSAQMVSQIISVAEDYYPNVINNISVGGAQQVLLHVRVMEVSRTKLRKVGFDWAFFNGNDGIVQNAAGLIGDFAINPAGAASFAQSTMGQNVSFGVVDGAGGFFGFLEALRQDNLAKVLAEPTLTTVSGRPASFNVGGEIPILVPQSLGTFSIEYREIGTRVDFVPIVLANGHIRLDVRPTVSEIDPSRSVTVQNVTIPGIRSRWVDTGAEMRSGQTLAVAGLVQTRVEAERKGLPVLADLPWVGAMFRRQEETENEIELIITVTPEFVDAMDPHEVPQCLPGGFTRSPSDTDFYGRGYIEVPKCCNDGSCLNCQGGHGGAHSIQPHHSIQFDAGSPQLQPTLQPGVGAGPSVNSATDGGIRGGPPSGINIGPSAPPRTNPVPAADASYRLDLRGAAPRIRVSQPAPQPQLIGPSGYDAFP